MKKLFELLKEKFGGRTRGPHCFQTDDDILVDILELDDEFDGINISTLEDRDVGMYGLQLLFVNKNGIPEHLKDYKAMVEDDEGRALMQEYEDVIVNFIMDNQGKMDLTAAKVVEASMQRACLIYKAKDDNWYMDLADEEYGELSDSICYGPFASEEAADKYLDDNHSNPGGYSMDNSGKREVPKTSRNGSPIVNPNNGRKRSMWSMNVDAAVDFFDKEKCDRCPNDLKIRKMSWFNDDTICSQCAEKEAELKKALREAGDSTNYEGCGYIPEPPAKAEATNDSVEVSCMNFEVEDDGNTAHYDGFITVNGLEMDASGTDRQLYSSVDVVAEHILEVLGVGVPKEILNEKLESYVKLLCQKYGCEEIKNPFNILVDLELDLDEVNQKHPDMKVIVDELEAAGAKLVHSRKDGQTTINFEETNENYDEMLETVRDAIEPGAQFVVTKEGNGVKVKQTGLSSAAKEQEELTREEIIGDILSHTSNMLYNNETNKFDIQQYFRKDLQKMTDKELVDIYEDMTTNEGLYKIVARLVTASAEVLGFGVNTKVIDGREVDVYDVKCDYQVIDGTQAANIILNDLAFDHHVGKMLMDVSKSDKIMLNGIEVDMEQIFNEIATAGSEIKEICNGWMYYYDGSGGEYYAKCSKEELEEYVNQEIGEGEEPTPPFKTAMNIDGQLHFYEAGNGGYPDYSQDIEDAKHQYMVENEEEGEESHGEEPSDDEIIKILLEND